MKKESKIIIDNRAKLVGKRFINYQGCPFTIIAFDGGCVINNRELRCINKGSIKNPLYPTIFNRGFKGVGKYRQSSNGNDTKIYRKWYGVFERCYCPKSHITNPTYGDCEVDEHWNDFQVFGKWFEENYKPEYMDKWELDKDILIKGNKIYSPETCVFVPKEINTLFIKCDKSRGDCPIGVSYHKESSKFQAKGFANGFKYFNHKLDAFNYYKQEKEAYIKLIANKWRGQITEECYWALMNYQVEITD